MVASKKIANSISKWNQVQEVLHVNPEATPAEATTVQAPQANPTLAPAPVPAIPRPVVQVQQKSAESSPAPDNDLEFADMDGLVCLLCERKMKSVDLLKRHCKESALHKVGASGYTNVLLS